MKNPDPNKYIVKKLRNKGYILVDKQILRWKEKRKKDANDAITTKNDAIASEILVRSIRKELSDMCRSSITNEKAPNSPSSPSSATTPSPTGFDFFGSTSESE